MSTREAQLKVVLIDDVTKPARTVAKALKDTEKKVNDVAKVMANTGASDKLISSLARIKLPTRDFETFAQSLRDYTRSAGLAADASKWTRAETAAFERFAHRGVASLRAVEREQQRYNRAMAAAERRATAPAGAHGRPTAGRHGGALLGGVVAAHTVGHVARTAIEKAREADDSVRYQGAISDLTPAERASRMKQATTLGITSGVKPVDILKAQETLAGRGVKKNFVEPFTAQIVDFSRAMKVSMEDAAKTLETIIFSTNQNVEDAATAGKVMQRQIDIAVKAAKMGGLSGDDIRAGIKFGGASAHGAGFKNETILAILATLSRAGYHGDEAGVAARGISGKLVSPTAKGLDALNALGISYNDFTRMPGGLSANNMNMSVKRKFGMSLSKRQLARINALNEQTDEKGESLVGNREEYVSRVSAIINESMPKNKKGQVAAKDRAKVAKAVGDFYKQAVESVDVEGLLRAILAAHPTLAQANGIVTAQHGGKLLAMSEKQEVFDEIAKTLDGLKAGFAHDEIAAQRTAGLSGAMDRAEAATDTLTMRIGNANAALVEFGANLYAKAAQKVNEAPDGVIRTATATTGAAAIWATIKGMSSFAKGGVKGLIGDALSAGKVISALTPFTGLIAAINETDSATPENLKKQLPGAYEWMRRHGLIPGEKGDSSPPPPAPDESRTSFDAMGNPTGINVDPKPLDDLKTKAGDAQASMSALGSMTVSPTVDQSNIAAFEAALDRILGKIRQIGPASRAAQSHLPQLGPSLRGSFSTNGPAGSE